MIELKIDFTEIARDVIKQGQALIYNSTTKNVMFEAGEIDVADLARMIKEFLEECTVIK